MKAGKIMAVLLVAAALLGAEPISLAVTQVEPIGVDRATAQLVEEMLQTEFSRIPLFQLVERGGLAALLQEQELQMSGITSAQSAAQAGNILNVQKVVFGSLARYDSEYVKYLLSLRLVDVERAAVEAAENIQIRSQEELLEAVAKISGRLSSLVELIGKVTRVEAEAVYTSLGEDAGIAPGDILSASAIELIKDDEGKIIMREENSVANLVVETVSPEGSRCRVLEVAGEIITGLTIRKGQVELVREQDKGSLVVHSNPENAKVFLEGEFLGVTPLTLTGLEPGKYGIEIRAGGGYKPYTGKITLKAGSNITLERELETDIDIEDILMLGKAPRRATDPKEALKKSLLPGRGAAYNGYTLTSAIVGMGVITWIVPGMFSNVPEEQQPLTGSWKPDWTHFSYDAEIRNFWIENSIFFGTALFTYFTSLLDAYRTADDEFLYPTFLEISMGATAGYAYQKQYPDTTTLIDGTVLDAVTAGVSGFAPGFYLDIQIDGWSYLWYLNLNFGGQGLGNLTILSSGIFYRLLRGEHLLLGIGSVLKTNFSFSESIYAKSISADALHPFYQNLYYPGLSLSYRSARLEADLIASPYVMATYGTMYDENTGDNTVDIKRSVRQNLGIVAELSGNYFFNLKSGIKLSVSYAYLKNIDKDVADAGYTDVDVFQWLFAQLGVVYRF